MRELRGSRGKGRKKWEGERKGEEEEGGAFTSGPTPSELLMSSVTSFSIICS